jgi:small-conductance mechanosensitive channel
MRGNRERDFTLFLKIYRLTLCSESDLTSFMRKQIYNSFIKIIFTISIIGIFIFPTTVYADNFNSLIGDDDIYEKNVSIEKPVCFNWTIYKNSATNYIVTVTAQGFESWDQKISPNYFFLDDSNPHVIVGLKATIPQYPEMTERTAIVTFNFRSLNSTETITITKNATIIIDSLLSEEEENAILGLFKNPLPEPLNTPLGVFILNVILWIFIAFALYYFIKIILIGLAKKTKTLFDDRLIEIVRRPFLFVIILYGAIQSVFKLHFTIGLQIYIFRISVFVFFVVGIYMIYRVYNETLEAWTMKKGGETSMFGAVLKPILKKIGISIIIVVGFIFALNASGVEVTALLAGAGIMGLVIAFAAQDTLSNFFSGIHLLLDRPFKIGDVIYLEKGKYWRVENVGMRSTRFYSIFDHELIIMPNNAVANQKIINIVKPDAKIRKKIKISVAYGTDLKKVSKLLIKIAKNHPKVVKEKGFEPIVRLVDFGESGIDFIIGLWIDEVMNQWEVLSDVRMEINAHFKKEHITIPFPQRTVWLNQINQPTSSKKENKKS